MYVCVHAITRIVCVCVRERVCVLLTLGERESSEFWPMGREQISNKTPRASICLCCSVLIVQHQCFCLSILIDYRQTALAMTVVLLLLPNPPWVLLPPGSPFSQVSLSFFSNIKAHLLSLLLELPPRLPGVAIFPESWSFSGFLMHLNLLEHQSHT